ncbi:MAG: DUF4271 domain-containing protein [Prevotellaceae bacterium]|jgi:hypothetical protein|nr:DUF4271 domain-containing protein [Prevotellaceae bacterium]
MTRFCQALTFLFEGIPLPYSPRMDDGITLVLLSCFLLSAYILARSRLLLAEQMKNFLLHRDRNSVFAHFTTSDMHYLLLLILQTCVLASICLFNYFLDISPSLQLHVAPYWLLILYTLILLFYLFLKWLAYTVVGWIFLNKEKTSAWMESYSTLLYYLGFSLFPFVLFLVYFDLSLVATVVIGLCLVVLFKILVFYKWLKLFCENLAGCFLLILYFCALEIIPLLLTYKGMLQLNHYLIINF